MQTEDFVIMSAFLKPVISTPGKERIAQTPFGDRIVIHATAAETNGAYGMWETFPAPGKGPALHTHTRETECFRVVRGTYRFRCGEDEFDVSAGAVVVLPPHVPHSFRNIGEEPGQMFAIVTPGGFEQFFSEIEAAAADTPEKVAVIEKRFGVTSVAAEAGGGRKNDR
jgi:mannose-6-phosphate isomerase-like protein (cupin superfamily)